MAESARTAKISFLAGTLALFLATSCKGKPAAPTTPPTSADQPTVIRIASMQEPTELLIPGDKPIIRTPEIQALGDLVNNIKGGQETAALPSLDAFITQYPNSGDVYPMRAGIRCIAGDLQGASSDAKKATSGLPRLVNDHPKTDRNEMLAIHAKLAMLSHEDATTSADLHQIVMSYDDDLNYLTDGAVNLTAKKSTPCAWSTADVEEWLHSSQNAPDALIFREIFTSAFAQYNDDAKALTKRYTAETIRQHPDFAPAYIYAAIGLMKIETFRKFDYSDAEKASYYHRLAALWSKAIQLDPSIEKAYGERAEAYLELKDYPEAIKDYDEALTRDPKHQALWNDRGLAKQDGYDKSGAVADFTQAIALAREGNELHDVTYPLQNRGDLYVTLQDYQHALEDYTTLIALRLHDVLPFINLGFIRELYPEYASVDDARLKDKIHRTLVPRYLDENFEKMMSNPAGMKPTMDADLKETYLKRADILLALKRFDAARQDYDRAELFRDRQEGDRWRTPPNFNGMALDVKTLETADPSHLKAWVRPAEDERRPTEPEPTRFTIDCKRRTVQMGERTAFEPSPGTYAEAVSDFFVSV